MQLSLTIAPLAISPRPSAALAARPLHAAEAAWLLLAVCRGGEAARRAGACIGELDSRDLSWAGGCVRRRVPGREDRRRHRRAMRHHARVGHDAACETIGVPMAAVRALLADWCEDDACRFLLDCVADGVAECAQGSWHGMEIVEVLTYVIGRRIAVRAPADHVCVELFERDLRFRGSRRSYPVRGGS